MSVQSYCPPRVVQRIFLLRSWEIVRGLWIAGSRGVAIVEGSVGEKEKKERREEGCDME